MVLLVRHRFSVYRRYEKDVWGVSLSDARSGKVCIFTTRDLLIREVRSPFLKYFFLRWIMKRAIRSLKKQRYVYRLDVLPPDRIRKKYNARFVTVRLTRLYSLTMQNYQFRSMFARANKADGDLDINYLYLLEGRSLCIYYRTLFTATLFDSLRFIKSGNLAVFGSFRTSYNSLVPIGLFSYPALMLKTRIQRYLWARVRADALLFNVPRFMYTTFNFMKILLLKYPKKLTYPIEIDITRMVGFYQTCFLQII